MGKIDLKGLAKRAENEDLSDLGKRGQGWEPEEGERYTVQAELVRYKEEGPNGMPQWGVMFKVVESDDETAIDRSCWANFGLVDAEKYDWADRVNAATFHYLGLFGLSVDVLASEEDDDVLSAVVAAPRLVTLIGKYRAGKGKHKGKRFADHHFEAIGDAVVDVVDDTEDDDEDDDFDY